MTFAGAEVSADGKWVAVTAQSVTIDQGSAHWRSAAVTRLWCGSIEGSMSNIFSRRRFLAAAAGRHDVGHHVPMVVVGGRSGVGR